MAERSITDTEIALIKGMLSIGMMNKDVQFYFNRPDRSVNSGRISGIRDGSYGGSANIAAARSEAINTFINEYRQAQQHLSSSTTLSSAETIDAVDSGVISKLFEKDAEGKWRLLSGESDQHECKTSFGMKHSQPWLRAIAALSNNMGGYIFFGVNDEGIVIGLKTDEFRKIDPTTLTNRIKSIFDPTPRFKSTVVSIGGHEIGVIHVERHESRPIISTKQDGGKISEGDIFYRYPGQSSRIKYSDLRTLLDARDKEARSQILPMVERLLKLGPDRSFIADLESGTLVDGRTTINIDKSLVDKLAFIKEGEFEEIHGKPTLRLVGDVTSVISLMPPATELGLITPKGLRDTFLNQTSPTNPTVYLRFVIEVGQGDWFPLHYFSTLAGMDSARLATYIVNGAGNKFRKTLYTSRIQRDAAYKAASGRARAILSDMMSGNIPEIKNMKDASHVAQAIGAMRTLDGSMTVEVLRLLKECLALLDGTNAVSTVRRAICRVDELMYADS